MPDNDGVWRTIQGRKVFIKKGQSLNEALKASGKFDKADMGKNTGSSKKTTKDKGKPKDKTVDNKKDTKEKPKDFDDRLKQLADKKKGLDKNSKDYAEQRRAINKEMADAREGNRPKTREQKHHEAVEKKYAKIEELREVKGFSPEAQAKRDAISKDLKAIEKEIEKHSTKIVHDAPQKRAEPLTKEQFKEKILDPESGFETTDNPKEALYAIDDILISGDFVDGLRGLDHNSLMIDGMEWENLI